MRKSKTSGQTDRQRDRETDKSRSRYTFFQCLLQKKRRTCFVSFCCSCSCCLVTDPWQVRGSGTLTLVVLNVMPTVLHNAWSDELTLCCRTTAASPSLSLYKATPMLAITTNIAKKKKKHKPVIITISIHQANTIYLSTLHSNSALSDVID